MPLSTLLVIGVGLLGAAVGSFLNVVIYRLPRGLSVHTPRRSFCPACGQPIRATDNVPILSWLRLGGRCRDCGAAISIAYPVVELLGMLTFLLVWDALFVGRVLIEVSHPRGDAPIAVAYLLLYATLLAASAMDVEEYMIDVRLAYVAMFGGLVGSAVWGGLRPFAVTAGMSTRSWEPLVLGPAAVAVGVALAAGWGASRLFARRQADDEPPAEDDPIPTPDAAPDAPSPARGLPVGLLLLATLALGAMVIADAGAWPGAALPVAQQRASVGLFILMVVMVLASLLQRDADRIMEETILAEQPRARRVAWGEFVERLPALLAAIATAAALGWTGRAGTSWAELEARLGTPLTGVVAGFGQSLAGLMLAAAIGWTVRIGFTWLFGKEAFGVGDIYLMAAIGAVGGVGLTVIAFFAGAILALIGVVATSVRKRHRALPFGPWLSLGALVALWLRDGALQLAHSTIRGVWMMLNASAPPP